MLGATTEGSRGIADCGLRIAEFDWQLAIRNPQSSILNPQSSIRIAPRMLPVPFPGRPNDVFELRESGCPAQFTFRLVRGGDEPRRVSRPARFLLRPDPGAGDLLAHVDDFPHRVAFAVAEVEEASPSRLQCQKVRLRQIHDVDVVTDARPVG